MLKKLAELKIGRNKDKAFNLDNGQIPSGTGTKDEEVQNRKHKTKG